MFKFSGDELRQRRRAAGLTVERLALAIDRGYTSVTLYERGQVAPPTPVVAALAGVLGCHPGDFYVETESAAS
jgi:transcriptional regulator with XRE-family HTH domain